MCPTDRAARRCVAVSPRLHVLLQGEGSRESVLAHMMKQNKQKADAGPAAWPVAVAAVSPAAAAGALYLQPGHGAPAPLPAAAAGLPAGATVRY